MTAPRVSEEEVQRAISGLGYTHLFSGDTEEASTVDKLAQESCVRASGVLRALLSERAALEAQLAEARKAFAREALATYGMCVFGVPLTKHHGGPFVNWLRREAGEEGE